jgi:hypothetical protein
MPSLGRRAKLAVTLVRALYSAKTQEEYRLRKAALEQTMEADLLAALAAKVSGRPSQKLPHTRGGGSAENAKNRRQRKRAAARTSAQDAEDSEAEAEVSAEREAAVEVAADAEKAQALRDLTQELTQRIEEAAARMAAAKDVQDSGDTKEEGETGDEELEAEEKGGEVKEQAGPSSPAGEGGGGCACSFSSSPVDGAHHSFGFPLPKWERKLSDEEQREEAKRPKSPGREGVQQAEQHGNGGEGGDMERVMPPRRLRRIQGFMADEAWAVYQQQ